MGAKWEWEQLLAYEAAVDVADAERCACSCVASLCVLLFMRRREVRV